MKNGCFKRIISMMMAICMVLTICPASVLAANEGEPGTITAGQLVAGAYSDLSQEEKELISSGLLANDVTYEYYVPGEEDELIEVDTENKTVFADSWTDEKGNVWKPVGADIIVAGSVEETVALDDGAGTYTYAGNAFSVLVSYEMYVTVASDVQKQMLNTAGWLKDGIANLDAIAAQSTNMGVVELAMPQLLELRDMSIAVGTGHVALGDEGKAAITAMNDQMTANGGKLTLNAMMVDYQSGSKTEYLLNDGGAVQPELTELIDHISALAEALSTLSDNVSLFIGFGLVDPETGTLISMLAEKVNALKAGLESAANGDWTATENDKGTALVKENISAAEYATLDTLVAALGAVKTANDFEGNITEDFLVAKTAIQHNLSMKNITVQVKLEVVENVVGSELLVSGGATKSVVLTLAEGAAKAEMEAALAETTVESEAIAAWGATYKAEHYVRSTTDLPETLDNDITYTITYSPAIYTITYDYAEAKRVPYGYQTKLELYPDAGKVYDYTVDGEYAPQGSVHTVVGDVAITRTTGKPYTSTDLYTAIAGMEGISDKEKAILTAGALKGNEVIHVRYPDTDSGALVSIDSDLVLTGKTYASDYKGLVWVPYSYIVTAGDGTDSALAYFQQDGDNYTAQIMDGNFQEIKVYYRLHLTNLGEDAARTALDLVAQLVQDAKSQNEALTSLSSPNVANNLDMLDSIMLTVLKELVDSVTLHEDAAKNARLKECFATAIGKIESDCLDGQTPRISGLIAGYNDSGKSLAHYYRNSASFITEVGLLSQYLNEMLAADANLTAEEKLAAVAVLIDAAPDRYIPAEDVDMYTQKLPNLQTRMNEINAKLLPVDPAIDTTNYVALNALVNALQMTGSVGTDMDECVYLQSQSFNVAGSGKIILKVNVICGEKEDFVTETVDQNKAISQSAIDSLKDKVAALLTQMGIVDNEYYEYTSVEYNNGAALNELLENKTFATNQIFSFTWVQREKTPCERGEHTEEILPAVEPTCTEPGLTQGKKCSICGEVLVSQQEVPAKGHTEEILPAVEPTCTATGLTEGKKCTVCNELLVAQQTVIALGHDFTGEWVKDVTGHWHVCLRGCGATGTVMAHSYNTDDCTAEAHCTICNFAKDAGEHAWGPLEKVDDAQHKQVCSSCGEELKSDHVWTTVYEKAATCEEDGYKNYTCSCHAEKTEEQTKLGHSWGAWTKVDDEKHTRVCGNDAKHVETVSHTWDLDHGVLNEDGDMVYPCTAECGATKLVIQNKEGKLESGATIKAQLSPAQDGSVVLPKPEADGFDGPGYRYDYVINGTTYKVTNASESYPINPGSVAGATMKLVNMDNEKLELLVSAMGAGTQTTTKDGLKATNDGYYTGIKVKTDSKGLMNVVMALVRQETLGTDKYGYVAVGNEPLLSDNKVSLLGLLRMMMTDGKYTGQDIIELCGGTETTLISNRLVLKAAAPAAYAMRRASAENDGHELDFQLTLTDTPAELGKIGAALTKVKDYVTFDIKAAYENEVLVSNRLDIDVKANLPAKVYEIYVTALRLVGKVDVNDANALKEAVAYEFLKDYVDVLLGADVTTTTLMNTAAKLGRTVDLSEYEGLFNAVKGKLDYGRNITYSADGLSASVTLVNTEMEKVIDRLEPMVGDAELMDILKAMVVECQDGETVDVRLNGFVTNFTDGDDEDGFIDTDYEAIIVDVGAAKNPGLQKADIFDITEQLATSVAGLKGAAAIMLQSDVTADLHFKNATILDLNGHTIDGAITADAKLIIIDSTLATVTVGGVTGAITGSDVTVLAGNYGTDVSSYLKQGYVQESGIVKNGYYEIVKNGNDIVFQVNADLLANRELPSVFLAADMAADLAMNYFTTAGLVLANTDDTNYQNAYSVFTVNFDNLVALLTDTTGEEKVNAIIDILKLSGANGIEGFLNDLMVKGMDFGALAEAINGNTDLIKYNMVTTPWTVKLDAVDGEDYLTVGIVPGEKVFSSVAVTVIGTPENKAKVADVLTEMGKIMDPTKNSITVTLQDPDFANRTLTVTGNGNVAIDIDMSRNPDYAAVTAVALAKSGVNKAGFVAALNEYFADNDPKALYEALSQVTLAQYITAVKGMGLDNDFGAMLANLGVTAGTGNSAVKLGDTFHLVLVAAGRILAKLDIDGNSRVVFGPTGEISYANSNVTRNITRTAAGITVSGTVTAESISVVVKLFPAICEHEWGDPEYTFAADGSSCIAKRVCTKNDTHTETAIATITSVVKTPAGCESVGTTTYTATFTEAWAATQTKDVDDIPVAGHSWGDPEYTFAADGSSCIAKRVCAKNDTHTETAIATITSVVKIPAGCESVGTTTYTATFTEAWAATQTKDVDDIPATGHNWDWKDLGNGKHKGVCDFTDPAHEVIENHVDANHNRKCDKCNASLSSGGGGGISAKYKVEVTETENGTVTLSKTLASKNTQITITVTPDEGYKVVRVIVTQKGNGAQCNVTAVNENEYTFRMPGDSVKIMVVFECNGDETLCPSRHLTDVDQSQWYHIAVDYVVSNGLMCGIGGNLFAPNAAMDRAMVVQVLYNQEGAPAVEYTGKFSDVPEGEWYTNAIEWGVANHLIAGYGEVFKPERSVSREEIATIFYNYAKFKGVDISVRGDLSAFGDGDAVSAWATQFMQWAVGSGLMTGDGTNLYPTQTATRAEVAQMFKNFNEIFDVQNKNIP